MKMIVSLRMIIPLWLLALATAHAQDLSVNKSTNKTSYKIGYFDTPPLSFKNNNNRADGFGIELLNEIARIHQFNIEWHLDDFPTLLEMMKSNQLDMMINAGYSAERDQFMDFSENNFSNVWGQVFLSVDSKVESLFDLNGLKVALMATDVSGINFINQCEQFEVNCQYSYGNNYQEIFTMLDTGQVDAAVSNNLVGLQFQDNFALIPSSIVFNPFKVYVAVPQGINTTLVSKYDQTMAQWKKDPESFYFQSRYRWTAMQDNTGIPVVLWYSILALAFFGILTGLAAILFKRQVNSRVKELSQQQVKMNKIINVVPHMIYANNKDGQLILANQNACDFFGINKHEIDSINIHNLLKSKSNFNNLIAYSTKNNPFNTEVNVQDNSGQNKTLMMTKVPYPSSQKSDSAVVTVGVDVTQIKNYEKEITFLAQYDSITGLHNREWLKNQLKSSLARANQFNHIGGILHIDLDNFKNINDSQGHKVGDELIKKVSSRIKSLVDSGDVIASLGGDEFIIELPELTNDLVTAEQQAIEVATDVMEKLKHPIKVDNNHFNITASVGIAMYPRDGNNHTTLLQRADAAMFEAKFKGRGRIQMFEPGIELRVKKNHQLENDLHSALKNNELKALYQPVIDAQTQLIVGSELLLRWHHPTEGVVMPADFIPIAERARLILEIGYWTIEEACKKIISWRKSAANPFFLAVNLSVIQIRDDEFLDRVTDLIQSYKIPHDYLEFEMTESILLKESQRSIEIIKQLKLLGIKLSIDDFGTGYSSFDYIRKLPLDKIKIDKSFIQDVPADTSSTTIVKTILTMAEEMQLEVVAEGVETAEQISFLTQYHCQYFQGFYFSKPTSEDQLLSNYKF